MFFRLLPSSVVRLRKPLAEEMKTGGGLEIFLGGKWEPFGDGERDALAARAQGAVEFRYETRGQKYRVDFRAMQQVNLASGRARDLRIQDAGRPEKESGDSKKSAEESSSDAKKTAAAKAVLKTALAGTGSGTRDKNDSAWVKETLDAHNKLRASHGAPH